jgi:hypothetical protein
MNKKICFIVLLAFILSSCGFVKNVFKRKEGCKSNGKNVGAEKIVSGNGKKIKQPRYKLKKGL